MLKIAKMISRSDRVKNELRLGVKEERNIRFTIKGKKISWIGLILFRNTVLEETLKGREEEEEGVGS